MWSKLASNKKGHMLMMRRLIALSALTTLIAAGCASNDRSTGGAVDENTGRYMGTSSTGAQNPSGSINNPMDRAATNQNWNANPPSKDSGTGVTTPQDELDSTPNPSRD
jgi:hypothetical protein